MSPSSVLPLRLVGLIIHCHQCEGHRPRSRTNKMLLIYYSVELCTVLVSKDFPFESHYKGSCCVTTIAWPMGRRTKGNISRNKRRPECKTTHISVAVSESHGSQAEQDQNLHSKFCMCMCVWDGTWRRKPKCNV